MINRSRGFTLIELVISITIFAFLSIMLNSVVSTSFRSIQISKEIYERVSFLRKNISLLEKDFYYNFSLAKTKVVLTYIPPDVDEEQFFVFFRNNHSNFFDIYSRSSFEAFSYFVSSGSLVKVIHKKYKQKKMESYLGSSIEDLKNNRDIEVVKLMPNVSSVKYRFSSDKNSFVNYNTSGEFKYLKVILVINSLSEDSKETATIERVFPIHNYKNLVSK